MKNSIGVRGADQWSVVVAVLILLFLAGPVLHAQPQSEDSEPTSLETVKSQLNARQFSRALETTDALIERGNGAERAEALNARGWTLFEMGESQSAHKTFEEALNVARDAGAEQTSLKILNNMGINLFVSGNLDSARKYFAEAESQGSTLSGTYLSIIDSQKRYRQIREHIAAGIAHRLNLKFPQAIDEYSKALDLDPRNTDALSYRGYAHFRNGNYDEAFFDIESVLRIDPGRLDALINYIKAACASDAGPRLQQFLAKASETIHDAAEDIERDTELKRVCADFSSDLRRFGIDL